METLRRSNTSFVCDYCHVAEPHFLCLDCRKLKLCTDCRSAHGIKEKTHLDLVKICEFTLNLEPEQIHNHKRWMLEVQIRQELLLENLAQIDRCSQDGILSIDRLINQLNDLKEKFTQILTDLRNSLRLSIEEANAELIEHEFDPSYEPRSELSLALRKSISGLNQPVPQLFTYAIDGAVFADVLSILDQISTQFSVENGLSIVRLGRADCSSRINAELEEFKRGLEADLLRQETIVSEAVKYLQTSNSNDKEEWVNWVCGRFQQRETDSGSGWDQSITLLRSWTGSVLDAFNIGMWRSRMIYELPVLSLSPLNPPSLFFTHLLCLSGFAVTRQSLSQMSTFLIDCISEQCTPLLSLEQMINISTSSALIILPSGNALLCGGGNPAVSEVYLINTRTGSSRQVAEMKVKRRALGGILVKNAVFVFGGTDKNDLASAEMFEGETEMWTVLPDMLHSRCKFNPCAHQDLIYLCGGHDCDRAETFDISTQQYYDLGLTLSLKSHGTCSLFIDEELVILQDGLISRWKPESGLKEKKISELHEELYSNSPPVLSGQLVYLFNFRISEVVMKVDLIEGVATTIPVSWNKQ